MSIIVLVRVRSGSLGSGDSNISRAVSVVSIAGGDFIFLLICVWRGVSAGSWKVFFSSLLSRVFCVFVSVVRMMELVYLGWFNRLRLVFCSFV